MRIFWKNNVLDEAKNRIRMLFDDFDEVIVSFSWGKDSTICLHLALEIAKERNRLPLTVIFIDQEAEWTDTEKYMEYVQNMKDVNLMWFQMSIKLFNATSYTDEWLMCWEVWWEWLHKKNPKAITENVYGTDRFHDLFTKIINHHFKWKSVANIWGVRAEESPTRLLWMTQHATYKWITWGKVLDKKENHYTFYPIYDWSYTDVWKYINDNNVVYNKVYDYQYQHWVELNKMRVSNLHHETALSCLFYLPEVDMELYNKLTKRLDWIHTANKFKEDFFIKDLPFMFKDWRDYRDYLYDKLITNETTKKTFISYYRRLEVLLENYPKEKERMYKACVQSILVNDIDWTKLHNYYVNITKTIKLWKMK